MANEVYQVQLIYPILAWQQAPVPAADFLGQLEKIDSIKIGFGRISRSGTRVEMHPVNNSEGLELCVTITTDRDPRKILNEFFDSAGQPSSVKTYDALVADVVRESLLTKRDGAVGEDAPLELLSSN